MVYLLFLVFRRYFPNVMKVRFLDVGVTSSFISAYTHTHTHTHTRVHTRTHIHAPHIHTNTHACARGTLNEMKTFSNVETRGESYLGWTVISVRVRPWKE
jgi:hypothetical protein